MPTTPGIANISAMRPLPPFSRIAVTVALAVVAWEQRRRTRLAIRRLDPHLLRDIGIETETARAEARKPFWRT